METRFGYEKLDLNNTKPIEINDLCSNVNLRNVSTRRIDNETLLVDFFCNTNLYGRYLTIQMMQCGILEIYEITIFPKPGKLFLLVKLLQTFKSMILCYKIHNEVLSVARLHSVKAEQ